MILSKNIFPKKVLLWLIFLPLLTAHSKVCCESVQYPYQKGSYLFFLGEGKANPSMGNKTQRRSLSQGASILDGKAKIAVYLNGLKTKNKETVEQASAKNQKIKLKVSAFLDGVQIVESSWDDEDNCKTVLKINKKKVLRKLKAHE